MFNEIATGQIVFFFFLINYRNDKYLYGGKTVRFPT